MATAGTSGNTEEVVGKYSDIDHYGFMRGKDFDFKSYEAFVSEYGPVLIHRKKRWNQLLNDGKKTKVKLDIKVKRFCRKGIPQEHRRMVWMSVSGAQKRLDRNPGFYQRLVNEKNDTQQDAHLLSSIGTDLDRTFPDNVYFHDGGKPEEAKRPSLERVLTAIGRYKKNIGYCQGMNYIAALLLIVLDDEESVFWLFVTLLEDILPDYYCNDMIGLRTDMEVLTVLVSERNTLVASSLEKECVNWLLISSKWFICLYADVLPTDTVLRIWDCLFTEGSKILFRVALQLIELRTNKVRLASDMPGLIAAFKDIDKDDMVLECHTFMQECFKEKISLRMTQIKKLRKVNEEKLKEEERERLEKKKLRQT